MTRWLGAAVLSAAAAVVVATAIAVWPRAEAPPTPVCELGPTVPGIDVSYYQGAIDWPRVARAGMRFAFIRVSDGSRTLDVRFGSNWSAARRAGVMRGAYQYFRPDDNPIAQADLLIDALTRDRGELPPVIDVETTGGKPAAEVVARVRQWVDRVRRRLGVEPIVYTGPDFWRFGAGGADLTSQPLWLAHYTSACPSVPAPWTRWTFWQSSDRGQVPGIDTPVDLDVFAGTEDELRAFAARAAIAAPPPVSAPAPPRSPGRPRRADGPSRAPPGPGSARR